MSWTVPSFDDSTSPVWNYILRYSNEPIWDYNWQDVDSITLSMRAGQAANPDSIRIDWPSSDSILFIRLTTRDVFQHISALSNQIQVARPGVDTIITPPDTSTLAYVEWQKEIPELTGQIVMDVAQTIDGGIAVVSTTEDYRTGYHGIYVTKLDSIGNVVWNRSFTETRDYPAAILELPSGDLLVAGTTRAMGDSLGDACLLRLSSSGAPLDMSPIRVPGTQDIKDASLLENGRIVLVGTRMNAALAMTAELNGDTLWSRNYYSGNYCVVEGPTATAASVAVVVGDAGEVVVNINEYYAKGGHSYCGPPFVADLSLITFDAAGQITRYTTYGTETQNGWAWAGDLKRTSDGSFLVAGWDEVYGTGLFVRSISTARVTQWSYPLLGFAMRDYADVGLHILPDIDNDIMLIVGNAIEQPNGSSWTSKDIGIEAVSSSGNRIGQSTFGELGRDESVDAAIKLTSERIAIFWRTDADNKVRISQLRVHK